MDIEQKQFYIQYESYNSVSQSKLFIAGIHIGPFLCQKQQNCGTW
jgi:hypothetical protein